MCRGKHGLTLAYSWAAYYATVVEPDEKDLVQMRVQQLVRIIADEVAVVGVGSSSKNDDGSHTDEGEGDTDPRENSDEDNGHGTFWPFRVSVSPSNVYSQVSSTLCPTLGHP
ncbi:hypothetical protein C8F04DRAFT_1014408 [Mycena alexandri]|uniref:Uncharacterized protein n=1 Tax=Mycena alexandri TaxID=1745969 RepID=A0AAD6S496_9AGAR|nr:hypothetical protein C8F04DRAFT_1014408 [Mycena alexandri]